MSSNVNEPKREGEDNKMEEDEDMIDVVTTEEGESALSANASLGDTTMDLVQQKILHVLSIYPRLSMSMLQIGIGTGIPPAIWHPALDTLIAENRVTSEYVKASSPVSGREQSYRVIQLGTETNN